MFELLISELQHDRKIHSCDETLRTQKIELNVDYARQSNYKEIHAV